MRALQIVLVCLASLVVFRVPMDAQDEAGPRQLNIAYWHRTSSEASLDSPQFDRGQSEILAVLAERLFVWRPTNQGPVLSPCLAETWPEVTDDGKTLTIRIRKDVYFQEDETVFGADKTRLLHAMDVVTSLKWMALGGISHSNVADTVAAQIQDCIVGMREYCAAVGKRKEFTRAIAEKEVEGLTYRDPITVQIKLNYEYASIVALLAHPACSILSKEGLTQSPQSWVSTARFQWSGKPDAKILANHKYWSEPWAKGGLSLSQYNAESVRGISSKDGIDFLYLPLSALESIPRDGKLAARFGRRDSCALLYLGFNMSDPVWGALDSDGRALRKAVAQALDRQKWIECAEFGSHASRLAHEVLPPRCWPAAVGENQTFAFDPEAAARTLASCKFAGGKNPATGEALKLELLVTDEAMRPALFEAWKGGLAQLGIDLSMTRKPTDETAFSCMRAAEGQLYLLGWLNDVPEPGNFLQTFTARNVGATGSWCNFTRYNDPEYEKLFAKYERLAPSPENAGSRREILAKLANILADDLPFVPLAVPSEWQYCETGVNWPDMPRCAYDHARYVELK